MSANRTRPFAQVYDLRPAQLRELAERQSREAAAQPGSILDDLADGIEAIHACANLAGFSERPRALIFALASCARSRGGDRVELFDEELAELQGCSARTIRRQRADYLAEALRLNFDLVEIIEGQFDRDENRYKPTLYRFHVGAVVERVVVEARSTDGWAELERKRQRAAIRRAAERVYAEIPGAPARRRKRKRPRLATAEIATCQRLVSSQLAKLRDRAEKLPPAERERLLETPGDLRTWWLEMRAEMDSFCGVDAPQLSDGAQVEGDTGQVVRYPPADPEAAGAAAQPPSTAAVRVRTDQEEIARTPAPADDAAWAGIEARVSAPAISYSEIELCPPESPPNPAEEFELYAEAVRRRALQLQQSKGLTPAQAEQEALFELGGFDRWWTQQRE